MWAAWSGSEEGSGTLTRLPVFPRGGGKWAWAECGLPMHLTCIGCLLPFQLCLPASTPTEIHCVP